MTTGTSAISVNRGSYRDPDCCVFHFEGNVYRALSDDAWKVIEGAMESGVVGGLIRDGHLVPSWMVSSDESEQAGFEERFPGWRHFIRHETVSPITYPYEWSFSMLADAGLLHLSIQEAILDKGFSLKDASAFNVQFVGSRPVFIDLGSIERPDRFDVWIAYSQFCRMFLYPLLLFAHRGLDLRRLFLADVSGMDVEQTYRILGGLKSMSPGLFLDVFMQRQLNKADKAKARELKPALKKAATDPSIQKFNLERLTRKLKKLKTRHSCGGLWTEYADCNTYTGQSRNEKEQYIASFMEKHKPETVLDLGCNTGVFSQIAAKAGARVVAVDGDHDCVELLYRKARTEDLAITPMVVDLANPSPAVGFNNEERSRFGDRIKCEAVFALALLHHLLISANLSLPAIRDFMAGLTAKYLVIEFVEREDEMFQTLLALRKDTCGDISLATFQKVFGERFEFVDKQSLSGARRHLFTLRKKED